MFPQHPEHLTTFDYRGFHRYSIRFCTKNRTQLFTTQEVVDLVLAQFLRSAEEEQFAIITYCFMPDHVHLLIEGRCEASDGKRFIALAKQYSGFYYKKQFKRSLWQRYGFERVLRSDEATLVVARYIIENPVRAGLVTCCRSYPFTGSSVYTLDQILDAIQDGRRSG